MSLLFNQVAGFTDLSKLTLAAYNPAFGIHVGAIALNAQFGMISTEVFPGFYKNGDTVPLPVSTVDGYDYDRTELLYFWATETSYNPDTGNPNVDSLWFGGWKVDQTTGEVFTSEYYRKSDPAYPAIVQTTDGVLQVFTIGIRRMSTLSLSAIPSFVDVANTDLVTDGPWKAGIAQQLLANSKFAQVSSEIMYMGEFQSGTTVPQPVGADGFTYAYANVKFLHCWRWTTSGASFLPPNIASGQLGPMIAAINASTGAVTLTVKYIDASGSLITVAGHGRIAVFAFCSRASGLSSLATGFAEIPLTTFLRPHKLRASTLLTLNNNIRESVQSPEFFGPTSYGHGATISLPVGADGYTYTRAECQYLWEWEDTTSESGSNLRVTGWYGKVNQLTGGVTLTVLRLQPGGPYIEEHTTGNIRIKVITVATRERNNFATSPTITGTVGSDFTSGGAGTIGSAVDVVVAKVQPYSISINTGMGRLLDVSEVFAAIIPDDVTTANWPAGLTGSYVRSLVAATASTVFDIIKVVGGTPTTVGSATFGIGATTATLAMASALALVGGNEFRLRAPTTPDVTLSGVYAVFSGTRT